MRPITRRNFVKSTLAAGLALGLPGVARPAASDEIRVAIIGLGGIDVPGSVGGRGRQLMNSLRKVPGTRIVALCDCDEAILKNGVGLCEQAGLKVAAHTDLRRVLEDKNIDAVMIAMPDHWHALGTVWACEAGKDVYVEKPISYNIWEGRQIVKAAEKHGRVVQVGTQGRSSVALAEAYEYLGGAPVGKIQFGHVCVYRGREGIGKVSAPTPVPAGVDYNFWCGPAPMDPIQRAQLHYDWHWVWRTGTGEMGNNGIHSIDLCRWGMGLKGPRRAMLIGGRYAWNDDGETPNTSLALIEYETAPLLVEIRGLASQKHPRNQGILIQYEGGYFTGGPNGGTLFDKNGQKMKEFSKKNEDVPHIANFIEAVRSRKTSSLRAPALEGHLSAAGAHMANISFRLGATAPPGTITETVRSNKQVAEAFAGFREHLRANNVDLVKQPAVLGPWVALDDNETYTGEFGEKANALAMREYRAPFVLKAI